MNKTWLVVVLVAVAIWYFGFHTSNETTAPTEITNTLQLLQNHHVKVTVFSVPGNPITYRAMETLTIYGFEPNLVPVNGMEDLQKVLPKDALSNSVSVPLFELPDGQIIKSETFFAAVEGLQPVNINGDKQKPYIVLYGIENCPYTSAARAELDQRGIPYQYIDMNTDAARYMGVVETRMRASGYKENSYNTPIIDVNGYMRPRMDMNTVMEKYYNK